MTIEFLIRLIANRLTQLKNARTNAVDSGDVALVSNLDREIVETESTLAQLNNL